MNTDRLLVGGLQCWVLALFIAPADMVIRPLGGQAHMANLLGMALALIWCVGIVAPTGRRPGSVHLAVALMWVATLAAWVVLARRGADEATWNGAERWVMVVLAFSGVALVMADGVRRLDDLHRLASTAVFAAAVASVVGVVQWRTSWDPSAWLRRLPGFTPSGDGVDTLVTRGQVGRVTGTALHPIEFGVGAALMLPVAVHLLLHDHRRRTLRRVVPLMLCALAVPLSVSRSAVIVAGVAVGVTVWLLPAIPRLTALATAPLMSGVVLMAAPGTASTITTSFLAAGDDSSIQARLDDFELVGALVTQRPWWGLGGGTYRPTDLFEILDNQYLLTLVEFGVVGGVLFATAALLIPLHLAARGRRQAVSAVVRSLAAAGLASSWGAVAAWAAFDAWAFPRFVGISALTLGTLGAVSALTPTEPKEISSWTC
jgi:O-antigen ligase